ncbi:MAG: hypothetical protein RIQ81_1056 [Pseudomonadota bacterium]|jgi:gamma-glutamylcyclotransferase (GGCT)/AIG2-like uncharacterized protein YtfP
MRVNHCRWGRSGPLILLQTAALLFVACVSSRSKSGLSAEKLTPVFVYGTLKEGGRLHHYLDNSEKIFAGWSRPGYDMYDLGSYPGIVAAPASGRRVYGEVYLVDGTTLRLLDRIEDAPRLYQRRAIAIDSGEPLLSGVQAYYYVQDVSRARLIESGFYPVR